MFEGSHVDNRFHYIVPGTLAESADGISHDPSSRKHDHRRLRRLFAQGLDDLQAADPGHSKVYQHDFGKPVTED